MGQKAELAGTHTSLALAAGPPQGRGAERPKTAQRATPGRKGTPRQVADHEQLRPRAGRRRPVPLADRLSTHDDQGSFWPSRSRTGCAVRLVR